MSICRESVCMADDVDSHTRTYTIEPTTTVIDIFPVSDTHLDVYKRQAQRSSPSAETTFSAGRGLLLSSFRR